MKEIIVKEATLTQEGEELVKDYLESLRRKFKYQDVHLEDIRAHIEDEVYSHKQNLWYCWPILVDFEYIDLEKESYRELDQEVFEIPAKFFTITLQLKEEN